jgi:hypothetical protein
MKVVEGLSGGIAPGRAVSVADLVLPVKGAHCVVLVFWTFCVRFSGER